MSDLEGFGFVMPHWLYWGWLAFMPLIMIALVSWRDTDSQPAAGPEMPGGGEPQALAPIHI